MKREAFFRTAFRYTFEFVAAGAVGWIYEVTTLWIMYHYYENRGILHLPIIPIYPIGAFILLALLHKRRLNPVVLFLAAAVITTLFELAASYLLEFIFHQWFWTYEGWFGSILDRSSVVSSAIFGLLAVVYFFGLHPLSGRLSRRLPVGICAAFSIISAAAVAVDLVISVCGLLISR
ncbi:MAG: putative ABC transporter permease [Ruminococcus sp.]|nr:putative ABC transporter permease [Ruminococcus sp.]